MWSVLAPQRCGDVRGDAGSPSGRDRALHIHHQDLPHIQGRGQHWFIVPMMEITLRTFITMKNYFITCHQVHFFKSKNFETILRMQIIMWWFFMQIHVQNLEVNRKVYPFSSLILKFLWIFFSMDIQRSVKCDNSSSLPGQTTESPTTPPPSWCSWGGSRPVTHLMPDH